MTAHDARSRGKPAHSHSGIRRFTSKKGAVIGVSAVALAALGAGAVQAAASASEAGSESGKGASGHSSTAAGKNTPEVSVKSTGDLSGLKKGQPIKPRTTAVRNTGESTIKGFTVGLQDPEGEATPTPPPHGNCWSDESTGGVYCKIAHVLKPGETVRLEKPLSVPGPKNRLYTTVNTLGNAPGQPDDSPGPRHHGKGPALGVTPASSEGGGFTRMMSSNKVSVDDHTDLRAQGDTADGRVGKTVSVQLAGTTHGPNIVADDGNDKALPHLHITAPKGTHIVGVPEDDGTPRCSIKDHGRSSVCKANDIKGSFRLRVDDAKTGKGKVAYVPNPKFSPHDPDRSNDSAAIVVHAKK